MYENKENHVHIHDHAHEHKHEHIDGLGHDHNHGDGFTGYHSHGHVHKHEHGHDHDHDHDHEHAKDKEHPHDHISKDEKTLRLLISHWIDHNKSHEEDFVEWAQKARIMGKNEVSKCIFEALDMMRKADEILMDAKKKMHIRD